MKLTKEQKEKYIASGETCPFCGSPDIDQKGMEGTEGVNEQQGVFTQRIVCTSCKAHWVDVYKLIDVVLEE